MIVHSSLWVVLPQCHVSLLSVMLGSIDTDVFVSGTILQVSKIGWVRVCLMSLLLLSSVLTVCTGIFFFTLALFGFSCLSSLGLFANERILFIKERCVRSTLFLSPLISIQSERILLIIHVFFVQGTFSNQL
jgi:hypothetical protein